jgi:hypothetical protein
MQKEKQKIHKKEMNGFLIFVFFYFYLFGSWDLRFGIFRFIEETKNQ